VKTEARRVRRAVMLGLLCATLASTSCWLALGIQDRTQAEGTGGTSGTSSTGSTAGTGGAGPDGGGCDGGLHFGTPQVYGGQTNPTDITVDPGHAHVFWIDYNDCYGTAVMELSKVDGGLSPSAVAIVTNQRPLNGLVSDGVALWTAQTATTDHYPDGGVSCNIYSGIAEIPLTGATPPPELFGVDNHGYTSMSLVGKTVAFADNVAYAGSIWVGNVTTGELLNDGGPLQSATGPINAIAAEMPSTFYWQASGHIWGASPGSMPTCIAVAEGATSMVAANGWLYWTDATDGTVRKVELPPQQMPSCTTLGIVIAQDPASPQGIAVDATNVYWASNIAGGAVHTVPVASSGAVAPTSVYVASSTGVPVSVATDGVFVYATIGVDNEVVAVPIVCN
jgi:hypothetical protein